MRPANNQSELQVVKVLEVFPVKLPASNKCCVAFQMMCYCAL